MQKDKKKDQKKNQSMSSNQNHKNGEVRIISGLWRGRKLPVLSSDGLRPTGDRVKETLFNVGCRVSRWLQLQFDP